MNPARSGRKQRCRFSRGSGHPGHHLAAGCTSNRLPRGRSRRRKEATLSYVAIARKWRPRSFEDIAGQGHVTRTLGNAISGGRIHHAYLFSGARGVGKTTAARTLARCLNCLDNGPRPDPCGTCACCTGILAGSSPDVIEIDGASNNSVDDIRDIRDSVRYLPAQGRYKVYIVDEVHMLSKGAFNALLKTLEEPPAHVVFIFATTESQKIPETILSRVQRFDFKRIPIQVVSDCLAHICEAEGVQIPVDGLRLIARAGEGSMRDSQSLLDQVISFAGTKPTFEQVAEVLGLVDRGLLYSMLQGMLRGEPDSCLEAIDQVYRYGYDLSEFTAELLELLRNATLVGLSAGSRRFLDVPDDERLKLEELARDVPPEVFVRSFQVMLDVHDQVARAARPRLVLEMAVARLSVIRPARPLDDVVQRLVGLEARLRQVGAHPSPREGRGGSGSRPRRPSSDDDESEPAPAPQPRPEPEPPPPLPAPPAPQLSEAERFLEFQRRVRAFGPSADALAIDSVLLGAAPPELQVGVRTELGLKSARRKVDEPGLRELVAELFPGCTRLAPSLVVQLGTTIREADSAQQAERRARLQREVPELPSLRRVLQVLGGKIEQIEPAERTGPELLLVEGEALPARIDEEEEG